MAGVITIAVKILRGKEAQFVVAESEAISQFKHLIAQEFDVPEQCQRLVFRGKTLADSGKLCDYNIKHGMKVHLFIQDDASRPSQSAAATRAQTTLGMAVTSAQPLDTAAETSRLDTSASALSDAHTAAGVAADCLDVPDVCKNSKLWARLDVVLQQHFTREDAEKVKRRFFAKFYHSVNSLTLQDLEDYAAASLQR